MIGYDYVRTQLVDILRFLGARNTTVYRDKKFGITFFKNPINHRFGQTVAVRAFGNIYFRINTEIFQRVEHNCGSTNAVRIVIPKHRNRFSFVASVCKHIHRFPHSFH